MMAVTHMAAIIHGFIVRPFVGSEKGLYRRFTSGPAAAAAAGAHNGSSEHL